MADWGRHAPRFHHQRCDCVYLREAGGTLLTLEDIVLKKSGVKYPLCLDGQRACPPEDCGGIDGYQACVDMKAGGIGDGS